MKSKIWLSLIFLGSLWGITEGVFGDFLYNIGAFHPSIFLTSIAFFILALGRRYYPKPGSSTLIGAIAVLFRVVNASPHYCHLFAIFLSGLAFDIVASLLSKKVEKRVFWRGIMGSLSVYLGYTLFSFTMTYIIHYPHWVRSGISGILNYIGFRGSLAAIGSFFTVLSGYSLGKFFKYRGLKIFKLKPALTYGLLAVATIFLWIAGRIV